MSHGEISKFPALADLLQRRSPDIAEQLMSQDNTASRMLLSAHELGDNAEEDSSDSVIDESVFDLVKLFLDAAQRDTQEVQKEITSKIKLFAILELFSTGIVLLASAGLIFTLFGESKLASLVIGVIIFISSFVGTIVSYLERVHGGSNSLHQLNFAVKNYTPQLKSIEIRYSVYAQSKNEVEAMNVLTELEELSKAIAETRAHLGLPITVSAT